MIGTADLLIWGDLVTKEQVRVEAFLNTLAEAFVPLHNAKVLFLTPAEQSTPLDKPVMYIRRDEILVFFPVTNLEPVPDETEVRRYEPVEAIIGAFQIEGSILKSPIATLENLLLVGKEAYLSLYNAQIRCMAQPRLGTFSSSLVQLRRDRLLVSGR
jgi:hypothetical protein